MAFPLADMNDKIKNGVNPYPKKMDLKASPVAEKQKENIESEEARNAEQKQREEEMRRAMMLDLGGARARHIREYQEERHIAPNAQFLARERRANNTSTEEGQWSTTEDAKVGLSAWNNYAAAASIADGTVFDGTAGQSHRVNLNTQLRVGQQTTHGGHRGGYDGRGGGFVGRNTGRPILRTASGLEVVSAAGNRGSHPTLRSASGNEAVSAPANRGGRQDGRVGRPFDPHQDDFDYAKKSLESVLQAQGGKGKGRATTSQPNQAALDEAMEFLKQARQARGGKGKGRTGTGQQNRPLQPLIKRQEFKKPSPAITKPQPLKSPSVPLVGAADFVKKYMNTGGLGQQASAPKSKSPPVFAPELPILKDVKFQEPAQVVVPEHVNIKQDTAEEVTVKDLQESMAALSLSATIKDKKKNGKTVLRPAGLGWLTAGLTGDKTSLTTGNTNVVKQDKVKGDDEEMKPSSVCSGGVSDEELPSEDQLWSKYWHEAPKGARPTPAGLALLEQKTAEEEAKAPAGPAGPAASAFAPSVVSSPSPSPSPLEAPRRGGNPQYPRPAGLGWLLKKLP